MSLILEALKKSEQQRRLGETPDLATPVMVARRGRSLLPILLALIGITLAAGWWLVRAPSSDDAATAGAALSSPTGVSPTADGTARPAGRTARSAKPVPVPGQSPTRTASTAGTTAPALTTPTPQDLIPPPRVGATQPIPPNGKPFTASARIAPTSKGAASSAVTSNPPGLAAPAAVAALPTPLGSQAGRAPATLLPPAAENTASNARAAQTPAPATTPPPGTSMPAAAAVRPPTSSNSVMPIAGTPPPVPTTPALPMAWELPYATRKDLPPITLTMHVYSDEPKKRFVIVNDGRHVIDDDLGNGLVLREIRADGVVLEFQNQRFVYPRSGH